MREIDVHDVARLMLEAHGSQAIAEAAQKAVSCEKQGEIVRAKTWRHIQDTLKMMNGPHQS